VITVVGSVNVDIIMSVPRLPARGETVLATDLIRSSGGKGGNQAAAAARAGSHTCLVARCGADQDGEILMASLRAAGVDVSLLVLDESEPSGLASIVVGPEGDNTIVVVPGANFRLSPEDVDRASSVIRDASVLALQLEVPVETVTYAAHMAREAGVKVMLNASPARAAPQELLRSADFLIVNEGELAMLTGIGSPVNPETAAKLLVESGCPAVVVTLGQRGAMIATKGNLLEIAAPMVDVRDTTGAGDAFAGNLAAALDRGDDVQTAGVFACYAAALSVTRSGAQTALPSREETERLMKENM
jgi:ribokinase